MASGIMDGGDTMIEVLNANGVEYIFASPGSEWPPLWEALSRRKAEGEPSLKHPVVAEALPTGPDVDRKAPQVVKRCSHSPLAFKATAAQMDRQGPPR